MGSNGIPPPLLGSLSLAAGGKNLEFSNPVHKNLETYKSIMKNQLLRKNLKIY